MAVQSEFRFSPRPNRAGEIPWRAFGPEAFAEARERDCPVLLSLSAVWCHWCHVMDETTYSDGDSIRAIADSLVPIRVDRDQRPDIDRRYNQGGWPTTVFLTPDGQVLTGGTYLSPDRFLDLLQQVLLHWRQHRSRIEERLRQGRTRRPEERQTTVGAAGLDLWLRGLESLEGAFDRRNGGFGQAPKFPHFGAVGSLLDAAFWKGEPFARMARQTLDAMAEGEIRDREMGGFFRYATMSDWSVPHFEKMLEDNAAFVELYLEGYRLFGEPRYREIVEGILLWANDTLRRPGSPFFGGSQDADEAYYRLPKAERLRQEAPFVDPVVYVDWNAAMARGLLRTGRLLGEARTLRQGETLLDALWEQGHAGGEMLHAWGGAAPVPGFLRDQVEMARALLTLYEVTGRPDALLRADTLLRRVEGAYRDGDLLSDLPEGRRRDLPPAPPSLEEHVRAAQVFLEWGRLTGQQEPVARAEGWLLPFADRAEPVAQFAGDFLRTLSQLRRPPLRIAVTGEGRQVESLVQAASSLYYPGGVVAALDREGAEREGYPSAPPAAYLCLGTRCLPPEGDPARLPQRLREALD